MIWCYLPVCRKGAPLRIQTVYQFGRSTTWISMKSRRRGKPTSGPTGDTLGSRSTTCVWTSTFWNTLDNSKRNILTGKWNRMIFIDVNFSKASIFSLYVICLIFLYSHIFLFLNRLGISQNLINKTEKAIINYKHDRNRKQCRRRVGIQLFCP